MKKTRKPNSIPILQTLIGLSLALAFVSAQGEPRALKTTEGDLAIKLFGLIAEQSGCSRYAVAWLELTTQQVRYRCHDTSADVLRFTVTLGNKTKFLIDVLSAKAEYRQRFGNVALPRPTSLLAHDLVIFRGKGNQNGATSPILIHPRVVPSESTVQE